jgi:muramoyltetrapeptide carboxypeptidase
MKKKLYIAVPANAVVGPIENGKFLKWAFEFAQSINAEVVQSPLMKRYMGTRARLSMEERVEDLLRAVDHDIVWACRGGFGCLMLLPFLAKKKISNNPILIGFSDITSLHAFWRLKRWRSCYGRIPMETGDSRSSESLGKIFKGEKLYCDWKNYAMVRVLRAGRAKGEAFAGCLTVMQSLCGTSFIPNFEGSILFIEDVDEKPWQWDNALTQLYLSGALSGVRGLVGGSSSYRETEDYGGPTIDEVLLSWAKRLQVPCISRLPFGHLEDAMVVPNQWQVRLEAKTSGRWLLEWNQ